jgi:hypothetical protein
MTSRFLALELVIVPLAFTPVSTYGQDEMGIGKRGTIRCAVKICGSWRRRNHQHRVASSLYVLLLIVWKSAGVWCLPQKPIFSKSKNTKSHLQELLLLLEPMQPLQLQPQEHRLLLILLLHQFAPLDLFKDLSDK